MDAAILVFLVVGALIPLSMERVGRLLRPSRPAEGALTAPYESGIEAVGDTWQPQPIRYAVYAMVFVLFDAEAAILYPWADAFRRIPPLLDGQAVLFVLLLLGGLVYAWKKGVLTWI